MKMEKLQPHASLRGPGGKGGFEEVVRPHMHMHDRRTRDSIWCLSKRPPFRRNLSAYAKVNILQTKTLS